MNAAVRIDSLRGNDRAASHAAFRAIKRRFVRSGRGPLGEISHAPKNSPLARTGACRASVIRSAFAQASTGTQVALVSGAAHVLWARHFIARTHMRSLIPALLCAVAVANAVPRANELANTGSTAAPLALVSARVSLDGTSNVHAFTASTSAVRMTAIDIDGLPSGDVLDQVLQPGVLKAFDVVIPSASLSSPKEGIDKNMHKALKVQEHPDIRFRVRELVRAAEGYRAVGLLTIAGVEKEVALDLRVERKGSTLGVTGTTDLLMTDFGIAPPKAMLGMLKTNPKVTIRIELVLGASLT